MIYVLIDIDETILSVPKGINAKASSIMFKKVFGIDAHEEMIDNVGKTEMGIIPEVLEKVGLKTKDVPEKAYKVWGEATDELLNKTPARVLPGIPEFLETLSNDPRIKLELLTGNSPWRAEAKLKSVHLDKFFCNSDTKQLNGVFGNMTSKRDELFNIFKKQARFEDRFIIVDDSIIGARMAKINNVLTIMVATGRATEEQLKTFSANVFSNLGDNRWKTAISIINKL